ncbi:MAG: hypothetical protein KGO47_07300 [Cyanobacteria bacterium REEB417]|nr:hypothetical protein [Cyanobacteria bacterium REEB417]
MSPRNHQVTVAALADLLNQWPRRGADGKPTRVLIGDRFPDLAAPPVPAATASCLELDDGGRLDLCLFPREQPLPAGVTGGDKADALGLAAEALRYSFLTPVADYDHEKASELALRAITAIDTIQRLERSL